MRILYVEDSKVLLKNVSKALNRAGFAVDTAADGASGLELALTGVYDVLILDVMLPNLDGLSILAKVKEAEIDAAVLMLSARVTTADRVQGLNLGADDYLIKPFQLDELIARIHALVRRKFGLNGNHIEIGNLSIDLTAQRVFIDSEEITFRPREFEILQYLMCRSGSVVSRSEILEHVYNQSADLKSNAIDVAICTARKKLKDCGSEVNIRTIPRRGYLVESQTNS